MSDASRTASEGRGFTIQDGLAFQEFWGRAPVDLSPDGRFLAYTTHNYVQQFRENAERVENHVPSAMVGCTAYILDIAQNTPRAVMETGSSWGGRWSPDGERLAFFSDHTGEAHLCVWHRDTDRLQVFLEAVVYVLFEFETARWSPDGRRVFFKALPVPTQAEAPIAESEAAPPLQFWDAAPPVQLWESPAARKRRDAAAEPMPPRAGSTTAFAGLTDLVMADLQTGVMYRIQSGTSLRSLEVSPDGRQLAVSGNVRFSQPLEWRLEGDRKAGCLLILPHTAASDAKAPLIVWGYPGNIVSTWTRHFGRGNDSVATNPEYFAAHGCAVLLPDIPLATNEPLQEITRVVLAGVDAAIATGLVDGERIGVIGHSYGGYMVNCLITQTQRFQAAVSSAPIGNLVSFTLGEGDAEGNVMIGWAEGGQGRMGGTLWEQQDRYIRNSPVFSLDQVETPLLLIAVESDPGHIRQAVEMFCGLRRLNKEVALLRYKDGVHNWAAWPPRQLEDLWTRLFDWFDARLSKTNASPWK